MVSLFVEEIRKTFSTVHAERRCHEQFKLIHAQRHMGYTCVSVYVNTQNRNVNRGSFQIFRHLVFIIAMSDSSKERQLMMTHFSRLVAPFIKTSDIRPKELAVV